ncbi:hypothetical protein [Pseudomonas fluorescens]|uniref:hypothetical protein n=1 Tax=Pseudomonas fluorescens TaxID=294 RepID=UPI001BEA95AF|nr:hypothetical protein [Pseudomonas fluorescens]MBT2375112.1 hypothetical protein [Pseudomonas fluorescens]
MQVESFFEWLGQALGSVIRFIVDGLSGLFNGLTQAGGNFIDGLSRTLGMDTSIISIITLIIGLMLLYSAVRAFMRASIIMGIIWLMLGLWLLSWVVH